MLPFADAASRSNAVESSRSILRRIGVQHQRRGGRKSKCIFPIAHEARIGTGWKLSRPKRNVQRMSRRRRRRSRERKRWGCELTLSSACDPSEAPACATSSSESSSPSLRSVLYPSRGVVPPFTINSRLSHSPSFSLSPPGKPAINHYGYISHFISLVSPSPCHVSLHFPLLGNQVETHPCLTVSIYAALVPPVPSRRDTAAIIAAHESARRIGSPRLDLRLRKISDLLSLASIVLFILANVWIFSSQCDRTSPLLYYGALSALIISYCYVAEVSFSSFSAPAFRTDTNV